MPRDLLNKLLELEQPWMLKHVVDCYSLVGIILKASLKKTSNFVSEKIRICNLYIDDIFLQAWMILGFDNTKLPPKAYSPVSSLKSTTPRDHISVGFGAYTFFSTISGAM
jgi:hypothetical protein